MLIAAHHGADQPRHQRRLPLRHNAYNHQKRKASKPDLDTATRGSALEAPSPPVLAGEPPLRPMGSNEADKPLRRIGASFEELATVAKQPAAMAAGDFSRACSHVSVLFGCLGIAFKFAEMDYVAKVNDLVEASKSISTLPSMVELDIQKGTVRVAGSHTRNLLRVKRGIDMVKVLFEQILITEGNSLKDAASKAYAQVFAPHHGWAIRKAVGAGMYALPSKSQLLKKLNEDDTSARAQMQSFVRSSGPVILYIENLFTSRNLGLDW